MAPGPLSYCVISLPRDECDIESIQNVVGANNGEVLPYNIPELKIGTLDSLIQQADELNKLETGCQNLVTKVGDSLKTLLDGVEDKIAQQKVVNDKPTEQYLRTFAWNKVRYRADKPIGELIDYLQKELATIDNDVKTKFNQYTAVKTNLSVLQRKQTGNLSTKSLTPIVDPSLLVSDSEYLETHLIAVPNNSKKEFLKGYEKLNEWVVPRSAMQVAQDDEFALFTATTFKKYSEEFLQKCREHKWTPRQYKHVEGGREEEQRELDRVTKEERKLWGEALRLTRTGWSEGVMIWAHVLTLRVFVETVLRYGLPLAFVSAMIITPKVDKLKDVLSTAYASIGGNAMTKSGDDDGGEAEYLPYVFDAFVF